jgi:hypothetical protein
MYKDKASFFFFFFVTLSHRNTHSLNFEPPVARGGRSFGFLLPPYSPLSLSLHPFMSLQRSYLSILRSNLPLWGLYLLPLVTYLNSTVLQTASSSQMSRFQPLLLASAPFLNLFFRN